MENAIKKNAITIIPFIALALLVTVAAGLAGKAARIRTATVTYQQPGAELPVHSYSDLMNNLLAVGGR